MTAYFSGHFIDIGWAAAFLTFGMAALISRRVPRDRGGDAAGAVPGVDVVAVRAARHRCPGVYSAILPTPGLAPIYLSLALLMSAVMLRQFWWSARTSGC